jgi:YfiH family protein
MIDTAYMKDITSGFETHAQNRFVYLTSPLLAGSGLVRHCMTTRLGGVSPAPFDTLNFSKKREKNRENILNNYRIVADAFGLDIGDFCVDNYAHSYNVVYVDKKAGGLVDDSLLPFCDGISTDRKDIVLVTLHADCLPLFFLDAKTPAITMAHAGWKGIYSHIVLKAADFMRYQYGTDPKDIIAAIGPSIGPCCFEVQQNVAGLFQREFGEETVEERQGRLYVDLWKACLSDMAEAGIPAKSVNCARACTSCDHEHFYSHRRDKGKTGAMMAFMQLK